MAARTHDERLPALRCVLEPNAEGANKRQLAAARVAEGADGGGSVKLGEGELPLVIDEATAKDIQGPISIDAIGPTEEWESVWTDRDAGRRASCSWDAALS